jgi:hypothetical protein
LSAERDYEDLDPNVWIILPFLATYRDVRGIFRSAEADEIVYYLVATKRFESNDAARKKVFEIFWPDDSLVREFGLVQFKKDEPKGTFKVKITPIGMSALTHWRIRKDVLEAAKKTEVSAERVERIEKSLREMNIRLIQIFGIFVSVFSLVVTQILTAKEMAATGNYQWMLLSYAFVVICILALIFGLRFLIPMTREENSQVLESVHSLSGTAVTKLEL